MGETIGRESDVDRIESSLTSGQGVLLVGDAGVGKSHLAADIARRLGAQDWKVEAIVGGPSISTVQFGAVQHLAGPTPAPSPDALVSIIERSLQHAGPSVLVVDDIDGLDVASIGLVHQLAASGTTVLATVRSEACSSPDILALWKDEVLQRFDVGLLQVEHTAAIAERFLGSPLARNATDAVADLTLGNPLFIREVLTDARSTGALVETARGWDLDGPLTSARRVGDLLGSRLADISAENRSALELIALGDPMPVGVLMRVVTTTQLEDLEGDGLIAVDSIGACHVVRVAHPLLGDVVRQSISSLATNRLRQTLAGAVLEDREPRSVDLLRAVRWALDAGETPDPSFVLGAAMTAVAQFDGATAIEFLDAGQLEGSSALLTRGRAELLAGDPAAAADTLQAAEDAAADGSQRASAATSHAEVAMFALGDVERADRVLDAALDAVDELGPRASLAGLSLMNHAVRGDFEPALDLGLDLARQPDLDDMSRLILLRTTTLAQVITGATDGYEDDMRVAARIANEVRDVDPTTGVLLDVTDVTRHVDTHGLSSAAQRARHLQESADPTVAMSTMYDYSLAGFDLFLGDGLGARAHVERASDAGVADVVGQSSLLNALASWVHAWTGDDAAALEARDRAMAHPGCGPRERGYLGKGYAAVLAHQGDIDGAVAECVTGAREARQNRVWAAWLLHDGVRLGCPENVRAALENEAGFTGTAFTGLMIEHASALDQADALALVKVADRFEEQGAVVLAAEALAQAAALEPPDTESAARHTVRALVLFERSNNIRSHVMSTVESPLSTRETEIASMAATGEPTREIAERLFVSTRTVENHLQRVYRKLGINQRSDLTPLFV